MLHCVAIQHLDHFKRTTDNEQQRESDIMSDGREWLVDPPPSNGSEGNGEDDEGSCSSVDSNDTLQNFIQFKSHRNNTGLEEAISVTYPLPESAVSPGTLLLSTLLEEDDIVPLFDGAGWAGTRVWAAAIWGIKYLIEEYGELINKEGKNMSMCELGCGLGVPGMVWHQMGQDAILTDQESIMHQMVENVKSNFGSTFAEDPHCRQEGDIGEEDDKQPVGKIFAKPLSWSREGFHTLLRSTGYSAGYDIVLNCDCVYEPLYGKSWELLVEVIDECLKVNPKCIVVTSVERRTADGIDQFVQRMRESEHVGQVERIMRDDDKDLELYITKGISKSS